MWPPALPEILNQTHAFACLYSTQVKWIDRGPEHDELLVSISTDGRVTQWSIAKVSKGKILWAFILWAFVLWDLMSIHLMSIHLMSIHLMSIHWWIELARTLHIRRVGQNRIYTPYMTVCMVIPLLKIPYVHRIYVQIYGSGPPYIYGVHTVLFWGKSPNIQAYTVYNVRFWPTRLSMKQPPV